MSEATRYEQYADRGNQYAEIGDQYANPGDQYSAENLVLGPADALESEARKLALAAGIPISPDLADFLQAGNPGDEATFLRMAGRVQEDWYLAELVLEDTQLKVLLGKAGYEQPLINRRLAVLDRQILARERWLEEQRR